MGSAHGEDKLTFEVNLPDAQRLVIHFSSRIGGKLEAIKDKLDLGLTKCLSDGKQQPISNLIDDLKNFQQNWCQSARFLRIDETENACHLHLTEIRETALQLMLCNKVTSRLKNSHLLVPQLPAPGAAESPAASAAAAAPALSRPKPKPAPRSPKPQRPPKSPALAARMAHALRRHESESSVSQGSPAKLAVTPAGSMLSASASSVAASDSAGSDLSDINERCQSPRLDLRKTFYSDDILGGADLVSAAADSAAAAAAQNFECKNALEELIATEKKYIRRMELLANHYRPRVSAELPHLAEQLKEIFLDFETFWKLHQELLRDLERVSQEAGGEMENFRLGTVMAKYGHHLLLYSGYYTKYKLHLNQISEWMREEACKEAFQRARSDCPEAADRMLDVTSHMLEPVQRPLRYPMLMARYLKEIGENHPDHESAKRALNIIEKVTDGFNVKMSEVESLQKLLVILSEVTFPAELQAEKEKFICSQYLLSARVLKISSKNRQQIRYLILSSSMLLLCEVNALWKTVQRIVPVDKNLVLTLDEKLSADYPNCIRLQTQQKTYDISFHTLDDFDEWIAAFKRLNVTFGDSNATNEKFPWKTFEEKDLGRKQPMKLKDRDVSQCQACAVIFTVMRRRHHCRLCGGIFCGHCSKYSCAVAWTNGVPRRACFFCRNRINLRDGTNCPLDFKHRELIEKFNKRSEGIGARIQGYLSVRIDVQEAKKDNSPSFLQAHWTKMWCTVEGDVLQIYRMKKDFVAAHTVVLPMNLTVELAEDASEIRLTLSKINVCRLRMTDDSGLRSAEREASHLNEWFDILRAVSQALSA